MKFFSFLIKPTALSCNMQCKYCLQNSCAKELTQTMDDTTMENLIVKALSYDEETMVTFAFQGGEPTLATIEYFKRFTHLVDEHRKPKHQVFYSIQTNGLNINEEWIELFEKYNFLVGVSLDGYKDNHDYYRQTLQNTGTFKQVLENIRLLAKHQVQL